ncbi:MAG: hypothetical protein WC372_03305 [Candidatus Neomarinimicrobiota bacterium]|jgi:hypothetical protein
MKKVLVIALIAVLAFSFAYSEMTVGLRGGVRSGASLRLPMGDKGNAVEALLTYRLGIIVTGMYQWHKPLAIGEIEGLSWYFGGGAHVGISWWWTNAFALGIDGIAGVEYDFESLINLPVKLSLDYKPAFDIIGGWAGSFVDIAFTARYSF